MYLTVITLYKAGQDVLYRKLKIYLNDRVSNPGGVTSRGDSVRRGGRGMGGRMPHDSIMTIGLKNIVYFMVIPSY